ncbi:hypothetical protein F0U61_40840 [Archangium violaceum]|uniref:hypothetical protein n=1 Tax=Archangium violaceum TaxID=83451 RepID=UPI002B2B11BD|nr:hypothetical protein F0U61_40840 [Archangium violaceum]
MTPRQAEELLSHLKLKALGLDELHEHVRLSGSAWTRDQLELFLLCARGVTRDGTGAFHAIAASAEDDLGAAIVEAVRSFAGKPVPAAQVRARLPQHFVTTDEQVLAFARRTAGLEVFGPKLIRIAP